MTQIEDTIDDKTLQEAVETEEALKKEKSDNVSVGDLRRQIGFCPCEVTELRTLPPEEFKKLNHEDFQEDHICFRDGFGFLSDKTSSDLRKHSLSFPSPQREDVITVKYELVGADENMEIREFWKSSEFPERSFLRNAPVNRIADIVGKKVPIIRQSTYKDDIERKYVVASLAKSNLSRKVKGSSVPHMTVSEPGMMFKKTVASFASALFVLGAMILMFGGIPDSGLGLLLCVLLPIISEYVVIERSDWLYKRVQNIFMNVELPDNPYHNQFDSVSEFAEETTR